MILALLGLLAAKILATSLTMWIGGSGGVFAPSLFMGAMLGIGLRRRRARPAARPRRCRRRLRAGRDGRRVRRRRSRADHRRDHHLRADRRLPHHPAADVRDRASPPRSATRSPRTRSTPSSCAAAGSTSTRPPGQPLMAQITVGEAMGKLAAAARARAATDAMIAARFAAERADTLPVIDHGGMLLGVITAADVERALGDDQRRPHCRRARARGARSARRRDARGRGTRARCQRRRGPAGARHRRGEHGRGLAHPPGGCFAPTTRTSTPTEEGSRREAASR